MPRPWRPATGSGELTDEEVLDAVRDELRTDGRVEAEDLEVSYDEGVIYLDGVPPSEASHQVLLEIVQDVLDFNDVVGQYR
jgi:osmotically-inducible protein OsmY